MITSLGFRFFFSEQTLSIGSAHQPAGSVLVSPLPRWHVVSFIGRSQIVCLCDNIYYTDKIVAIY